VILTQGANMGSGR